MNQLKNKNVTRQLAKGGLTGISGYLLLKPLNLLTSVLLARFLGADGFGLYSLGLSINVLLNVFTNFGFPQGIVKLSIKYRTEGSKEKVKGVLYSSLIFSVSLCVLIVITQLIFAEEISKMFFDNDSLASVIIIFGLSIPFNTLYTFPAAFAQAFKKIKYQSIILNIARPLSFLLFTIVVVSFKWDLDAVLYANLISTIVTAVIGFYYILKYFPEFYQTKIKPIYEFKNLITFSVQTMFTGFLSILMIKIDRIMIGYFSTSSDVGIYSAAANLAINVTFFLTPFAMIFAPISAELFHLNKIDELNKAFKNVTRWLLIFTLPLFFIFAGFSKELLLMFGKDFTIGGIVLIVISIAELVNVSTGPVGILLKMSGHQIIDLKISFLVLVINASLNYILIPIYGLIGAAIATAIALAVTHIVRLIMVWKYLNIFPYDINTLKPFISFLTMGIIFFITVYFLEPVTLIKITIGVFLLIGYTLQFLISKKDEDDIFILNSLKKRLLKKDKRSKKNNSDINESE